MTAKEKKIMIGRALNIGFIVTLIFVGPFQLWLPLNWFYVLWGMSLMFALGRLVLMVLEKRPLWIIILFGVVIISCYGTFMYLK